MNIFLLEDEFILQDIIKDFLIHHGFLVTVANNGDMAEDILYEKRFDILLLDVGVPKIDGFKLLKNLRLRNISTPAIFITSLSDIKSVKIGFEVGCDDYIKKPFELDELLLRIKTIVKRGYFNASNLLDIGDNLEFDMQNEVLFINKNRINLHLKELKLLKLLIKNRRRVVSFDEIFIELWGEQNSYENIRAHVKNLRKFVPKIKNIRGEGYIFE